jgi:hypothetical protein
VCFQLHMSVVSSKKVQFCNSGSLGDLVKVFLFVSLGRFSFIQVLGDESCVWLVFVTCVMGTLSRLWACNSNPSRNQRFFSSPKCPDDSGVYLAPCSVGYWHSFWGQIKQLDCEVDQSPSS